MFLHSFGDKATAKSRNKERDRQAKYRPDGGQARLVLPRRMTGGTEDRTDPVARLSPYPHSPQPTRP